MSDNESFIYLRNTVSGVTTAETPEDAAHILAHAWFSQFHIVVDKPKDEVLAAPYKVDGEGNRTPIEGDTSSASEESETDEIGKLPGDIDQPNNEDGEE